MRASEFAEPAGDAGGRRETGAARVPRKLIQEHLATGRLAQGPQDEGFAQFPVFGSETDVHGPVL